MHIRIAATLLAAVALAGCGGGAAPPPVDEKWTLERYLEVAAAVWEAPVDAVHADLKQRTSQHATSDAIAERLHARMDELRELARTDSAQVRSHGFPCHTISKYIADLDTSVNFLKAFVPGRTNTKGKDKATFLFCDGGRHVYRIFLDKEISKNVASEAAPDAVPHHLAFGDQIGIQVNAAEKRQLLNPGE